MQPWCLSIQSKTCPWAEHSDDDDDIIFHVLYQCYILLLYMLLVISILVYHSLTAIQEVPGLIPGYTLEIFLEVYGLERGPPSLVRTTG